MKLEDHLSAYRQRNGLSQRALAKMLGVSDMTISRIEAGQNFRITNAIYEALIKIISPSDILNLEEMSPAVRRLKHLARESQSDPDFRLTALDAPPLDPDLLDSTVQSLQYIEFDSTIDEFIDEHFDHSYTRDDGKIWCIDEWEPPAFQKTKRCFLNRIFESIGKCLCNSQTIHKYSILTSFPISEIAETIKLIPPQTIPHDFSIIHLDPDSKCLDYEFDVFFHDDGHGLFDLAIPEKATENERKFASWKACLAKKSTPRP